MLTFVSRSGSSGFLAVFYVCPSRWRPQAGPLGAPGDELDRDAGEDVSDLRRVELNRTDFSCLF